MLFAEDILLSCCQGCSDSGALLRPNGKDSNHYADIPDDTPDIENLDFYAAAVSIVFCSFKTPLDASGDYMLMAHHVARNPTEAVWKRVQRGDAASMLELAMRYGSGCEAEGRLDEAIEFLDLILARAEHDSASGGPPGVPAQILQSTRSAAALVFYSKYRAKRITGTLLAYHDHDLLRAAAEADRAAVLVAEHLTWLGRRHGRKLVERIQERPQQFRCAAEDCDVRTMNKRMLKRCSGGCTPETKPSYCSKECQRRDWPRHKAEGCIPVRNLEGDILTPGSNITVIPDVANA